MFKPEDTIQYLRKHEGVVNYMYLDVVGLVTIGVGFLLPNAASAQALALVRRDAGAPATDDEKRADWEAVHAQPKAELAAHYRPFTFLDLPDSAIDGELTTRIDGFVKNLQSRFPRFEEFPDAAQIGIIDMVYSLGPAGLFRGFPKFCSAVDHQDWPACAREGVRGNVSQARNDELQQLFLEAAAAGVKQ
jgi:GH24 family phage-related lysozyme (muramidase)